MKKNDKYFVSVIIPVYNIENYIDRCLDSLVNQKRFNNIEVIIVDDGSSDNSSSICKKYSSIYDNVYYFRKENGGVSSARNFGLKKVTGDYVLFVDGDDYLDVDYVYKLYESATKGKYDLVIGNYELVFDSNKRISYRKNKKKREYTKEKALDELLTGGNVGNNLFDKLFKSKIAKTIEFNSSIKIGEDLLYIYYFIGKSSKIFGLFENGYFYYQRKGSAMNSSFSEKQFDIIKVVNIICSDIKLNNKDLSKQAKAFEIYSKYKLLERIYKSNAQNEYKIEVKKYKKDLNKYGFKEAYNNFSFKKFIGYSLMRLSPKMYIIVCRIKKI